MSLRPRPANTTAVASSAPSASVGTHALTKIATAQAANGNQEIAAVIEKALLEQKNATVSYDSLNPTEKAVAQLGVSATTLGGMKWLNEK